MSTELATILDDGSLITSGDSWGYSVITTDFRTIYYKSSYRYARVPQNSFDFWFDGTSAAFYGFLPNTSSQMPVATIDGETVWNVSNDHPGTTYGKWFQSPTLVDGVHRISVTNCSNGTIFDYAIVNVGTHYDLISGSSDIIVDNESPSIFYSGHWTRNTSDFVWDQSRGYPYGNSTHRSSTPGDTFTFRFTGTSVSVYGSFTWTEHGVLAATFTLDGGTLSQTHNITDPSNKMYPQETPNFLYYSIGSLPPGDHTLIVNVTVADNHAFVLDYITYKPSFRSLLSMPLLNTTTPTTVSGSINSELSTPGGPSNQPSSQVQTSGAPQLLRTVAILGGTTGVLALVLVAILGRWLFLRWRKAKQVDHLSPYPYEYHHQLDNDTNNQVIPRKEQTHVPQLQPLRREGPLPAKFMRSTDSH